VNLQITYQGDNDPFEGDRTLWLRSLPAGARVTKATVTLTPKGGPEFQETITFEDGRGDLGTTKISDANFVEVDLHARRTLAVVGGTNIAGAILQVDLGGTYVEINGRGAVRVAEDDLFEVPNDGKLPGLTVSKFRLCQSSIKVSKVIIRSVPTNVSVRVGVMPPFWTHLGELVTDQTSPDFAAVLNAFLAEAKAIDGFYAVPFVVHSDTIAQLDVKLAIDYAIEQPVLPSYLPEVNLPYGYSSLPGVEEDFLTVKLPRGATIVSANGAVLGTFDATRIVFGEIGESESTSTVEVSPDRSLAQPILLDEETPVSGIDLPLANTEPGLAGLHLALQEDADGKPSGKVLSSANVSVERPVPGGSSWGSAALPAEFRFLSGERYWLVLQSVSGNAHWGVRSVRSGDPEAPVLQASSDGGFSWRMAATDAGEKNLAAIFRLRHSPERFKVPLQLQIGRGEDALRVSFNRFAPLGRVEFDADFAAELGEYLTTPSMIPPCGSGNLLVNGSLNDPPPVETNEPIGGSEPEIWCRPEVPAGWNGIPGRVLRYKNLQTDQIFAILLACDASLEKMGYTSIHLERNEYYIEDNIDVCFASDLDALKVLTGEPAELSQRFSVVAECTYILSVRFHIGYYYPGNVARTPPRWQIKWLNAEGESLVTDGEPLFELDEETPPWLYEARLTAPSGATEAEIRFIQSSPGILFLESVSFSPTLETLSNGFFVLYRDDVPLGWQLLGGPIRRDDAGIVLEGAGPKDTILTQTAQVTAENRYELRVCARPMFPVADDVDTLPPEQRARVELRWLTDEGEIGEPVILFLDGRDFPAHTWVGDAPLEATLAEIRLIQPQNQGDLLVESVSLEHFDLVAVPLIFLAEAPGELAVSDLGVAYDLPAPFEPSGLERRAALKRFSPVVKRRRLPDLAKKDATFISGVGKEYSKILSGRFNSGKKDFNIENLAALDLSERIEDVPSERVLEMKTAAEIALACASMAGSDYFASLAGRSLNSLLELSPKDLAREAGQPRERARAEQLQRNLRALRFLLKNEAFLDLRLSDLMPSR